jgi:two-component system, NarL family, invasion response regulator UvrY
MADLVKIALVDDHTLLRDALGSIIDKFEGFKVILLARHGKELIDKLQNDHLPDLVLLDLDMPVMDGYETAKWLHENYPTIYVLVLSVYDSEMAMIRLLQFGVRGFLKKDIHPNELRNAIQSTMTNGYYYFGNSTSKLINLLKDGDSKINQINSSKLTQNELQFLMLASTEITYKEIALKMNISPRTVDSYRDALFIKLNVKSRVGLVLFAIKNGLKGLND